MPFKHRFYWSKCSIFNLSRDDSSLQ